MIGFSFIVVGLIVGLWFRGYSHRVASRQLMRHEVSYLVDHDGGSVTLTSDTSNSAVSKWNKVLRAVQADVPQDRLVRVVVTPTGTELVVS